MGSTIGKIIGWIILAIICSAGAAFLWWFFSDVVFGKAVNYMFCWKWSFIIIGIIILFGDFLIPPAVWLLASIGQLGWYLGKRSTGRYKLSDLPDDPS